MSIRLRVGAADDRLRKRFRALQIRIRRRRVRANPRTLVSRAAPGRKKRNATVYRLIGPPPREPTKTPTAAADARASRNDTKSELAENDRPGRRPCDESKKYDASGAPTRRFTIPNRR